MSDLPPGVIVLELRARVPDKAVPVLFVDLDGTVRHGFDELGRWVNTPEDVVIFDGVADRLWRYKDAGWRVVAVSNQGGIALGHVTLNDAFRVLVKTQALCREVFDKAMICQHHPDAPDPEMARCWCRKPRPGLALEAVFELAAESKRMRAPEFYPPHLALFVGDREEDRLCAEALNVDFMSASDWRGGAHHIVPAA
jgi:D-glycero-D-manno-heptose 1,7-bisphosphate phosphatase